VAVEVADREALADRAGQDQPAVGVEVELGDPGGGEQVRVVALEGAVFLAGEQAAGGARVALLDAAGEHGDLGALDVVAGWPRVRISSSLRLSPEVSETKALPSPKRPRRA
jgi:hypothetical protein